MPAEYLLAGAGADELIDHILRLFVVPGDLIIDCPPTFGMYSFDAAVNAARVVRVPRRDDFSVDVAGIEALFSPTPPHAHTPKLVFMTSPNNPDGSLLDAGTLDKLLSLPLLVVLDEAYIEFADPLPSPGTDKLGAGLSRIREVPSRDNLVVLRTFSKWAGLAGFRVGYGAFPKWLGDALWQAKSPYNVTVPAMTAAIAALQEIEFLQSNIERVISDRERLADELRKINGLHVYPSHANFLLVYVPDASAARQRLLRAGLIVRDGAAVGFPDHLRISVGTDEEWRGWWGPNPPFHTPVFVLTHHPRPSIEMEGGTTFHFIDASPAEALKTAREAAAGQDVRLGGGATVIRDFLAAGLVDYMHIVVVPILLGRGARLWEGLEGLEDDYQVEAASSPSGVTHVTFTRAT